MVNGKSMNERNADLNMSDAMNGAKLAGFNELGHMCLWFGGYSFNVYDAARNWEEVDHFTSGQISGLSEKDSPEGRGYAKARMRSEGYTIVE